MCILKPLSALNVAVIAVALLAACTPMPVPPATPQAPTDACAASGYQGLIGQPVSVLTGMTFPIGTRQIGPDDAVTADYRPDRLNIEYGASRRIEKIGCF